MTFEPLSKDRWTHTKFCILPLIVPRLSLHFTMSHHWNTLRQIDIISSYGVALHRKSLGMGRYEKYVDRDVANAKPYRIRDSAF